MARNIREFLNEFGRSINAGDVLCINDLYEYQNEFAVLDIVGHELQFFDINGDKSKTIHLEALKTIYIVKYEGGKKQEFWWHNDYNKLTILIEDDNDKTVGAIKLEESLFDNIGVRNIVNIKGFDIADMQEGDEFFGGDNMELRLVTEDKRMITQKELSARISIAMQYGGYFEVRGDYTLKPSDEYIYMKGIVEPLRWNGIITYDDYILMLDMIDKFFEYDAEKNEYKRTEYEYSEIDKFLRSLHPFIRDCIDEPNE